MLSAGGFITRRKVAQSSSRLYGLSNVMVSPFSVSNRASLKILAFAASDSPKSSVKIAKYRGEKAYGHSLKC